MTPRRQAAVGVQLLCLHDPRLTPSSAPCFGPLQLVFTRSATGALQLIGEMFPWSSSSTYAYARSNHKSVLGEPAAHAPAVVGGLVTALQPLQEMQHTQQLAGSNGPLPAACAAYNAVPCNP